MFSHFTGKFEDFKIFTDANSVIDALSRFYFDQIETLKAIGTPGGDAYALEMPTYPMLTVHHKGEFFCSPMTRPDLFADYYKQECAQFEGPFAVSKSKSPIPLALIDENLAYSLTPEQMAFRKINNLAIESVDECAEIDGKKINELYWFSPARVDYSINRLKHYTGVSAQYLQDHVIFVNYQKYLPFFIEFAQKEIADGNFVDLVGPGDTSLVFNKMVPFENWSDAVKLPQMPAFNLVLPDRSGITLINIGVGPSNAKTMADHLAVLRPKFAIMLGHCGGLDPEHVIGDYIFGSEHMFLDFLTQTTSCVSDGFYVDEISKLIISGKKAYVGPVVSLADRNWELYATCVHKMLHDFGAIGVDMEAAMMVKVFEDWGIPSASFLCVSDRPFHRQVRLQKMAENFYATKLRDHIFDCLAIMKHISSKGRVARKLDSKFLFR